MLHSFSLFRIANMLENWHQMDGNWLETIKHTYIAHMRKFVQKYHIIAIKQHFRKNALHLQSIQEKILPIIFPVILID